MDEREYKEICATYNIPASDNEGKTWKPLLRQCMICFGVWYIYLMEGLYLGAPTVMIAQIRREANSTEAVTDEMASWLSSTMTTCSLPLLVLFPWVYQLIGRKFTYLIVCVLCFISYIFFYTSTKLHHILISQIFFSASFGGTNTFIPILIAEYTSPKYRGIFLTVKSVTAFWGIWIANIIGTFSHWNNIALVSFVCSVYIITVTIWPESPYWLAMKGRYKECAESYRWLRGVDESSEKELAQLIIFHKNSQNSVRLSKDTDDCWCFVHLSHAWSTITSRSFYMPTLLCLILLAQYQFTGKLVITVYAIDVFKNMTRDESVAYKGMLILDGITVFSMCLGCLMSRYFKRRTLLFLFASIGIISLYILSLYLYLVSLSLVTENHVTIIFLLSVFSIAIGCGPIILSSSIYGEIIPARYQTSIMIIVGLFTVMIMSTLFKLSPFMFKMLNMHGCFLFFALTSTFAIVVLNKYLPETKDKTIHQIGEYFVKNQLTQQHETLLNKKRNEGN